MVMVDYKDKKAIEKEGWKKETTYDMLILTKERKIVKRTYRFAVDMFPPCDVCKRNENSYVKTMGTGVYKACLKCQITKGPLPFDLGPEEPIAEIVKEEVISKAQAFEHCEKTGMPIPFWLRP